MGTNIEWTQETWNPTVGCSKCSEGCKHCYAIDQAWIRSHHPNERVREKFAGVVERTAGGALNWTGDINIDMRALLKPIGQRRATVYFVNSMSDLFHPNMPEEYIDEVMAVVALCGRHTFQVLTKHPDVMEAYFKGNWMGRVNDKLSNIVNDRLTAKQRFEISRQAEIDIVAELFVTSTLKNLWLGTTVENQVWADIRVPHLLQTPAAVRFLSVEPMLGAVDIKKFMPTVQESKIGSFDTILKTYSYGMKSSFGDPTPRFIDQEKNIPNVHVNKLSDPMVNMEIPTIDWVICGGESGKDARPMHPEWAVSLRDQCVSAGVAFFFKQWGEWLPQEGWKDCGARTKVRLWADGSTETDVEAKAGVFGRIMAKVGKKKSGNVLDGRVWQEWPAKFKNGN